MITILFGEMGAGKNYLGANLAAQLGMPFIDGDTWLAPHIIKRLNAGGFITSDEIDHYYWTGLLPNMRAAHRSYPKGFVFAQALYNDTYRRDLNKKFPINWVWVKPTWGRHFKNLWSRPRGWRWLLHGLLTKPFFDTPTVPHVILKNRMRNELMQ